MPPRARARDGLGRRAPRREERARAAPRRAPRRGSWERAAREARRRLRLALPRLRGAARARAPRRGARLRGGLRRRRRLGARPPRRGRRARRLDAHDRAARPHRAHPDRLDPPGAPLERGAARPGGGDARSGSFPGRLRFLASIGAQRADRALRPGVPAARPSASPGSTRRSTPCARSGAARRVTRAGRFVQLEGARVRPLPPRGPHPDRGRRAAPAAARGGGAPRRPLGREPAADPRAAWSEAAAILARGLRRGAAATRRRSGARSGSSRVRGATRLTRRSARSSAAGTPGSRTSPRASSAKPSWREAPRAAECESRRSAAISASTCR